MSRCTAVVGLCVTVICCTIPVFGQSEAASFPSDASIQIGRQLPACPLLQVDVTTASRVNEILFETPVAVTIISREDIEAYGAEFIPELLRNVVGLNVQMYDSANYKVGVRNSTLATPVNNILVLIDGKNMYQNWFGFILWNALPISVDEIERIEIIRGPASSMYGANAAMGVINIITRTELGNGVRVAGGTQAARHGTVQITSKHDNFQFRTGLTYRSINSFRTQVSWPPLASRSIIANAELTWTLPHDRNLTFFAGATNFDDDDQFGELAYARLSGDSFAHVSSTLRTATAVIRAYLDRTRLRSDLQLVPTSAITIPKYPATIQEDVATIDYSQWVAFGSEASRGRLVWGGDAQANRIAAPTLIDRPRKQLLLSAFAQGEFRPRTNVIAMMGARLDEHPVTHDHVSPRASLTYIYHQNHAFRVGYGEAYRNPTIIETYGSLTLGNRPFSIPLYRGDNQLKAEEFSNVEAGYRGSLSTHTWIGVTAYDFRQSGIICAKPNNPAVLGCPTVAEFAVPIRPGNRGSKHSRGIETEVESILTASLKVKANYRWVMSPIADDAFRHVLNTECTFHSPQGTTLGVRADWYSQRLDSQVTSDEPLSLLLVNLHVSHAFLAAGRRVSPFATLLNVTNRRVAEIVDQPSDMLMKRSIFVGVRSDF